MKNSLMRIADKILLREIILTEAVNDDLKNIVRIEYFRYRFFNNSIVNLLSIIVA